MDDTSRGWRRWRMPALVGLAIAAVVLIADGSVGLHEIAEWLRSISGQISPN